MAEDQDKVRFNYWLRIAPDSAPVHFEFPMAINRQDAENRIAKQMGRKTLPDGARVLVTEPRAPETLAQEEQAAPRARKDAKE